MQNSERYLWASISAAPEANASKKITTSGTYVLTWAALDFVLVLKPTLNAFILSDLIA